MTAKKPVSALKKRGRKSKYTEALADTICNRLCDGDTLTSICRDIGINPSVVYYWTIEKPDFSERFTRARDFGDQVIEDSAIDISDERNPTEDQTETESGDNFSNTRKRYDNVARSRLMAETRLKVVARRKGGKVTAEINLRKKTEAEEAKAMSTDQLLEIARMADDGEETE